MSVGLEKKIINYLNSFWILKIHEFLYIKAKVSFDKGDLKQIIDGFNSFDLKQVILKPWIKYLKNKLIFDAFSLYRSFNLAEEVVCKSNTKQFLWMQVSFYLVVYAAFTNNFLKVWKRLKVSKKNVKERGRSVRKYRVFVANVREFIDAITNFMCLAFVDVSDPRYEEVIA